MTYASTQPSGLNELPICSNDTVQLSIFIAFLLHNTKKFTVQKKKDISMYSAAYTCNLKDKDENA
jgi:hypothetical protein